MDTDEKRDELGELVNRVAEAGPSDGVKWATVKLASIAKSALDELDKAKERIDDLEGDIAGLTDGQNQVEADLEQRLDAALAEVERLKEQLVAAEQRFLDSTPEPLQRLPGEDMDTYLARACKALRTWPELVEYCHHPDCTKWATQRMQGHPGVCLDHLKWYMHGDTPDPSSP